MANYNNNTLTFPQRNWFLLCILTAIITVTIYYFVDKSRNNPYSANDIKTSSTSAVPGMDSIGIPPDSLRH